MTGEDMIAEERARQREIWPESHDDHHDAAELIPMAECYLTFGVPEIKIDNYISRMDFVASIWPFDLIEFHPRADFIGNLVVAGALIAAEIDRLQRLGETPR